MPDHANRDIREIAEQRRQNAVQTRPGTVAKVWWCQNGEQKILSQWGICDFPWSNTNLNTILLNKATQNVTAVFAFVQKLSQAKSFEQVVKIQTEFMETQMNSFNEQAKILGEVYTKAAQDAMKTQFDMRK
jgi:hypothetical protein